MDDQIAGLTNSYPQEACKDDEGTTEDLEVGCRREIQSYIPGKFTSNLRNWPPMTKIWTLFILVGNLHERGGTHVA